jgi:hypothetical protein
MSDFESWRCMHEKDGENLFCPPEGCSKSYGCARDNGWLPGMPTPDGCSGIRSSREGAPQSSDSGEAK